MTPRHVVVIGAGITGLTAAYWLQHRARARGQALQVTVLEAGQSVGGHVQHRVRRRLHRRSRPERVSRSRAVDDGAGAVARVGVAPDRGPSRGRSPVHRARRQAVPGAAIAGVAAADLGAQSSRTSADAVRAIRQGTHGRCRGDGVRVRPSSCRRGSGGGVRRYRGCRDFGRRQPDALGRRAVPDDARDGTRARQPAEGDDCPPARAAFARRSCEPSTAG